MLPAPPLSGGNGGGMSYKKQARIAAPERIVHTPLGPLPETMFVPIGDGSCIQQDQSTHKAQLLAELAKAHEDWHYTKDAKGNRERTRVDQEGLNRRRNAVQRALSAFVEWAFAEADIPSEHLILLVELVSNLDDLNQGKQPELMKPAMREKRGNPGLSQGHAARLGTACAVIDILSIGSHGVRHVEKEVADAIGMKVGALKSWRKAFKAGSKDRHARIVYDNVLQICRQQDDPREAARRLLRKMHRP
jgi:hypothetical protein